MENINLDPQCCRSCYTLEPVRIIHETLCFFSRFGKEIGGNNSHNPGNKEC